MKNLFETVKLKNLVMKNRLIRSATWEGIAKSDGSITDETYEIYKELSRGGVGAIITKIALKPLASAMVMKERR